MTRDRQIKVLARRMIGNALSILDMDDLVRAVAARMCATIAIELAEATHREAGERVIACPDGTPVVDVYAAVRDMPLPIADGGGDG